MRESGPNPEEREHLFKDAVDRAVELALEKISERFERPENIRERLPFHNTEHTAGVVRRTTSILEAMRDADPSIVSSRDILIGRLAAAFHDTIQTWEAIELPEGQEVKIIRKRSTGLNEKASAEEAKLTVRELDEKFGPGLFTIDDEQSIQESIVSTEPGFDPDLQTTTQPHITGETSIIARAVALADLGIAGIEGPKDYNSNGDALFREENLDILDDLSSPAPLSPNKQERYRQRMLEWTRSQPKYAEGRKILLQQEIVQLPKSVQEPVRLLFFQFEASIQSAEKQLERRQGMSFQEIAQDMGYETPSEL